ncbi:MAG: hypothetical protein O9296_10990 [Novosphingobium sp.]|jgi:hypothetical protein|nr:hypothetical protein [Novosphingobium sp.]
MIKQIIRRIVCQLVLLWIEKFLKAGALMKLWGGDLETTTPYSID